jgi:uroporphyrinogen III methyltransferase/synthase
MGTPGELPLRGRLILLTREDDDRLASLLVSLGATIRRLPLTRTLPPEDPTPLRRAAAHLSDFDWVALTSARSVEALTNALVEVRGLAAESDTAGPRWACVGPATAAALRARLGIEADLVPEEWSAASLVGAMLSAERPRRVLFPAADNARPDLPEGLRAAGVEVTQVIAYRTEDVTPSWEELQPPGGLDRWDAIVLASGKAVASLRRSLAPLGEAGAREWLHRNHPSALGASAAAALAAIGVTPADLAERPVVEELAAKILERLTT